MFAAGQASKMRAVGLQRAVAGAALLAAAALAALYATREPRVEFIDRPVQVVLPK